MFFRYAGLLVFWLVTPGDGVLRSAEKLLFEEIKKESKAVDIWREPKYHISKPRDTTTYRIIIKKIKCNEISNRDSLQYQALKIAKRVEEKLVLNSKFINYEIIYKCVGRYDESFKFKRKEISTPN